MMGKSLLFLFLCFTTTTTCCCSAWMMLSPSFTTTTTRQQQQKHSFQTRLYQSSSNDNSSDKPTTDDDDDDDKTTAAAVDRTSFDQAGKSLIEEEDRQRMEQMGDFDSNPEYQTDSIEQMRKAIRARTADLGIEKSKVSQDYIKQKQAAATAAGSAQAASESGDVFGGLDLSQISSVKSDQQWDESMPSMLYNPEDEMTREEQEEADPIMTKSPFQQGLHELQNAKWPDFASAGREVALMLIVIAATAVLIIGWDQILRGLYTSLGFIPSKEELANYANRFDGLDLPQGWTNNMSEMDVQKLEDITSSSGMPGL